MSNKTSDKNVAKVEEDVKRCNELTKVEHTNWIGISNQLAISHILAEREQKDKRIQELKEQVKTLDEAYTGAIKESKKWFDIAHNSIPTQVVIDVLQEYKNKTERYDEYRIQGKETDVEYYENIANTIVVQVLQELLGGERK